MGRIVTQLTVRNGTDLSKSVQCHALVDTGSTYTVLPFAWKQRFGAFESEQPIELQTANQSIIKGLLFGPAKITVEGFRATYNEVLFIEMNPSEGEYEPLLGYVVLEQCGAAIDMLGHRIIPVKYLDLK